MISFIRAKKIGLLISFILVLSDVAVNNTKESNHILLPDLNHVNYLNRAYAHNDYEHPNPLFDALNLGFAFIEVDVHLLEDSLYVSHFQPLFPDNEKTLSKLYLEPLFKLQKLNNGRIYPNAERPLVLMVDIKTEAEATYQKLKNVLLPYKEMLCSWNKMEERKGAVKIVISGNRPIQTILKEELRYVQVDGRIEDLAQNYPFEFMPIISDNYTNVFGFSLFKNSKLKANQLKIISNISKEVHAQGKIIRLWNSPEEEKIWTQLLDQNVDLINTDELNKLNMYLNKISEHNPHITSK